MIIILFQSLLSIQTFQINEISFPKFREQISQLNWHDCETEQLMQKSYGTYNNGEMSFDMQQGSQICSDEYNMNLDDFEQQLYFQFLFNRDFTKNDKLLISINKTNYTFQYEDKLGSNSVFFLFNLNSTNSITIDFYLQQSDSILGLINIIILPCNFYCNIYNLNNQINQYNLQQYSIEQYWRTINQKIINNQLIFQGELDISQDLAPILDVKILLYDINFLNLCSIKKFNLKLKYQCQIPLNINQQLVNQNVYFLQFKYKIIIYFPGFQTNEIYQYYNFFSQIDSEQSSIDQVNSFQEFRFPDTLEVIYEPFKIKQHEDYITFQLFAKGFNEMCYHFIQNAQIQIFIDDDIQLTCHQNGCLKYDQQTCQFSIIYSFNKINNYYLNLEASLIDYNNLGLYYPKFSIKRLYINDLFEKSQYSFWLIGIVFVGTVIIPLLLFLLIACILVWSQKRNQRVIENNMSNDLTQIQLTAVRTPTIDRMQIQTAI